MIGVVTRYLLASFAHSWKRWAWLWVKSLLEHPHSHMSEIFFRDKKLLFCHSGCSRVKNHNLVAFQSGVSYEFNFSSVGFINYSSKPFLINQLVNQSKKPLKFFAPSLSYLTIKIKLFVLSRYLFEIIE